MLTMSNAKNLVRATVIARPLSAIAAAGLALALLVGCSGDTDTGGDEPSATASAEAPSEPAPSKTSPSTGTDIPSTAPTPPETATGTSNEALQAYVGYWIDTLNYATVSGDSESLRAVSTEKCQTCQDFAGTLDQIYGAGGQVETDGWSLRAAVPLADRPDNEPALRVEALVSPQTVTQTKGAEAETYGGGQQAMTIFLVSRGEGWLVDRLDIVT